MLIEVVRSSSSKEKIFFLIFQVLVNSKEFQFIRLNYLLWEKSQNKIERGERAPSQQVQRAWCLQMYTWFVSRIFTQFSFSLLAFFSSRFRLNLFYFIPLLFWWDSWSSFECSTELFSFAWTSNNLFRWKSRHIWQFKADCTKERSN